MGWRWAVFVLSSNIGPGLEKTGEGAQDASFCPTLSLWWRWCSLFTTRARGTPDGHPTVDSPSHGFALCGVSYPWSIVVWKQMILLKDYPVKVAWCSIRRSPHFISSCGLVIISHAKEEGEYSKILWKRSHPRNFYYSILLCRVLLWVIINLLLGLI